MKMKFFNKFFYLKIIICIVLFLFLISFLLFNQKQEISLKVLTYSSFAGIYGPGRKLQKEFESYCECRIEWILAEDSTRLFQRLKLKIPVDIVLGFDQITIKEFPNNKWKTLNVGSYNFVSEVSSYKTDYFIPINWSPIGFIYKSSELSFSGNATKDLLIPKNISFPEPRTSTLGLQFYYWIYSLFSGNNTLITNFLKKMKNKIYGPVFSWSLSYGFFQKGHVEMSLSYLTSLAYHSKESPSTHHFAYAQEGHPYQVELAGIPTSCSNCSLASSFLKFLMTTKAQKIIMKNHYMFPVIQKIKEPPFSFLKIPKLISYKALPRFLKQKNKLLKIWQRTLY